MPEQGAGSVTSTWQERQRRNKGTVPDQPALPSRRHSSVQRRCLLDQGPHLGRHHQKRGVQNQRSGGGTAPACTPAHHRYAALPWVPHGAEEGHGGGTGMQWGHRDAVPAPAQLAQTQGCPRARSWGCFPAPPLARLGPSEEQAVFEAAVTRLSGLKPRSLRPSAKSAAALI